MLRHILENKTTINALKIVFVIKTKFFAEWCPTHRLTLYMPMIVTLISAQIIDTLQEISVWLKHTNTHTRIHSHLYLRERESVRKREKDREREKDRDRKTESRGRYGRGESNRTCSWEKYFPRNVSIFLAFNRN